MYDTIYMVNLLLFKNGQVKSTALRLHKNRGSEEPKTRNFSTIVIQFMVRNFLEFKYKKQY